MATPASRMPDVKKLSFAKVAAAGARDKTVANRVASPPVVKPVTKPPPPQDPPVPRPVIPLVPVAKAPPPAAATSPPSQACRTPRATQARPVDMAGDEGSVDSLQDGVKNMSLEHKTPNLVVNGTSPTALNRTGRSLVPEQKPDSNSDLGTKPPSLDGKSIASGTTFALDEKESLRPDDSASMKAAADDDDAFSTRGSILAGSRMGSDSRAVRIQIGDLPLSSRHIPTVHESRAGEEDAHQGQPTPQEQTDPNGAPEGTDAINNALYGQNPDDKLLEAMNSPKDRLFLLRLEKEVIEFVQNSKEPFIDLPPCNSFCRLLTHKLADYYHMTHSYEAGAGSVRIFRTPFCRVPPSLASIAVATVSQDTTPPPVIMPKKIMRRGEEFGMGSGNASKATSEVGSEAKDKLMRELTREEREEAYNRARERIFGNSEKTGESTPENVDDANGVSRASSVSARDKSSMNKRGKMKRRDDNENFETRSQFAAIYGHPHQPWQPRYMHVGNSSNNNNANNPQYNQQMQQQQQEQEQQQLQQLQMQQQQPQQPQQQPQQQRQSLYQQAMGPGYMVPNQAQFTGNSMGNAYQYNAGGMGPTPGYPAPPPAMPATSAYPQQPNMNRTGSVPTYPTAPVPAGPVSTTPQQNWQQPYPAGASYPARLPNAQGPPPNQALPGSGPHIPYQFGALPAHPNPSDPKSQHPIPGSYHRYQPQPFNPKTQSFVPGAQSFVPGGAAPMMPLPPQQHPQQQHGFVASPSHRGSPQVPPASAYGSYGPQPPQQQYGGSGYGMSRQPSNGGIPPPAPPTFQPPMPTHQVQHQPLQVNNPPPPHLPNKPASSTSGAGNNPSGTFTHLPNYGNPATLPQKPPNPQISGV